MSERKAEGLTALLCLAAAVLLLGLCSMSSPLYPLNIWDDANCLFTVGRAMRAGSVLYRDIYEQKGPLLYVLHALAACISDTNFLGVYLMEVLALTVTLYAAYRLARCRASCAVAWTAAVLWGACVLVSRSFSRGDSAEEFCLPFLMTALSVVCAWHSREASALPPVRMLLCGVLAGAVAAIKYTALGLFVGLCVFEGIVALRERGVRRTLLLAAMFLLGMLAVVLPFLIYFARRGALRDAYTAYIYNNIFLYHGGERTLFGLLADLVETARGNVLWVLGGLIGVAGAFVRREEPVLERAAYVTMAVCAGLAVYLPGQIYPYYPLVLSVIAMQGFCSLAAWLACRLRTLVVLVGGCALALALAGWWSPNAFLRGVPLEETAQGRLAAQMEPGATLLQYSHLDDGLYLTAGALPQEKYFVLLNVELPEMRAALDEAVRAARPDYVLVSWRELPAEFDGYELMAHEIGYTDENRLSKDLYLYRRKGE